MWFKVVAIIISSYSAWKIHKQILITKNRANSNSSLANEASTTSSTGFSATTEQHVDEVVNIEPEPGHGIVSDCSVMFLYIKSHDVSDNITFSTKSSKM